MLGVDFLGYDDNVLDVERRRELFLFKNGDIDDAE